jgi:hypothetical protein
MGSLKMTFLRIPPTNFLPGRNKHYGKSSIQVIEAPRVHTHKNHSNPKLHYVINKNNGLQQGCSYIYEKKKKIRKIIQPFFIHLSNSWISSSLVFNKKNRKKKLSKNIISQISH